MKKLFKRFICTVCAVTLLVTCAALESLAAGTTIGLSKKALTVNEGLTVTVSVSANEKMYATECNVNYNQDVLRFDSGDSANGGAGTVHIVGTPGGAEKQTYSLNFTTIATGNSNISVTDCVYVGAAEQALTGSSVVITVADAALSANNNLASLKLSDGTLSPAFNAAKTSYTATVPFTTTACKVYATSADAAAKVALGGAEKLEVGRNTRTVTVTAPSGAAKTYKIVITRQTETEAPAESTPETPVDTTTDAYKVTVDGAEGVLTAELAGTVLPDGFTASTTEYNGAPVAIAVSSNGDFKVFFITKTGDTVPGMYLLDSASNKFSPLKYTSIGDNFYVFAEIAAGTEPTEDYYKTTVKINGFNVEGFAKNDDSMTDFFYLYCFTRGRYGFYRYDISENTLQREPEFKTVSAVNASSEVDGKGLIQRFNVMNSTGKVIVICIIIAALTIIALAVLLIIKLSASQNKLDSEEDNLEFDSIENESGFLIDNSNEDNKDNKEE